MKDSAIIEVGNSNFLTSIRKVGETMITKIKEKNQVTIPSNIIKQMKLKTNDQLQVEIINGKIVITPVEIVEKDFFETKLGKEIKEALEEYRVEKAKGNIKTYSNVDDLFKDLGVDTNE